MTNALGTTPLGSVLPFLLGFRNGERERLTWVHIPVFLLARSTIITLCKDVMAAAAQAIPTGP
jgi:hypothetical protein